MSRHPLKSQTIQTGAGLSLITLIPLAIQVHDHGIRSLTELQWSQISAALALLWGNIHGRLKAGGLDSWRSSRRPSYQELRAERDALQSKLQSQTGEHQ